MNDEVWKAALAGLLHDVGKFAQRAQEKPWDRPPDFDEGKEVYGKSGFHALWSAWFVKEYVARDWVSGYDVMTHHKPASPMAHRISLADWLSAWEREPDDDAAPEGITMRQLLSIFCRLRGDQTEQQAPSYLPLKSLRLERDALFPGPSTAEREQQTGYRALWEGFLEQAAEAKAIQDPVTLLEQYAGLLQQYTWCIPSAYYGSEPDVSLYDHSRMTAALAACMVTLSDEQITDLREALLKTDFGASGLSSEAGRLLTETDVACLVGGDISGVQDFIYTISSKGATSALRGRSAYLQLLTEATARYVLRRLEMPITNLIYAGGGHFFLLASPDEETQRKLEEIKVEVSQILLTAHNGDLYLAVEHTPIAAAHLDGQVFSQKWTEVNRLLKQAKDRRFSELGDDLKRLFTPPAHGGNEDDGCSVCHREHRDTREEKTSGQDKVKKCPACRSFEELGNELRRAKAIRLTEVDWTAQSQTDIAQGDWQHVLKAFGMAVTLDPGATDESSADERKVVWMLTDEGMGTQRMAEKRAVVRRLWVNVTPLLTEGDVRELQDKPEFRDEMLRVGLVKPFSVMDRQARGIHRLGVLRMDMDDAGKLISLGLGQRATLSRQAALSFALSLYFEGWVGKVAGAFNSDPVRGNNRIYSIYSSGDDLFFIGSWDAMPGLALEISRDLTDFVGGRRDIHASAGIAVVEGKYPLYQAAHDAHEALEASKSSGKNAITFLGQTMKWPTFIQENVPERAVRWQAKDLRAFVRLLIGWHDHYAKAREERLKADIDLTIDGQEQILWGPWMWHAAYMLTRMARPASEADRKTILEVKDILGKDFRAIEWMGMAGRWADLLGRSRTE